jgi:hypothetical protein
MEIENSKFLDELAHSNQETGGIISLSNKHEKNKAKTQKEKSVDPLTKYVKHFSELADLMEIGQKDGNSGDSS